MGGFPFACKNLAMSSNEILAAREPNRHPEDSKINPKPRTFMAHPRTIVDSFSLASERKPFL